MTPRTWALVGLLPLAGCAESAALDTIRCGPGHVAFSPTSELLPACGAPETVPRDPAGPAVSRLELATSPGGETWLPTGMVLANLGDVPSCLTTEEGLWVFFVLWEDRDGVFLDNTVAAFTEDLETWEMVRVRVHGLAPGYDHLVDPAVVELEHPGADGERRLYWVAGREGEPARLFAGRSLGMDSWELEEGGGPDGSIAWATDRSVLDPSLTWLEERGEYWLFAGGLAAGHRRATSLDGLSLVPLEPEPYVGPEGQRLKPSHGQVLGTTPYHWAFEMGAEPGDNDALWRLTWEGDDWRVEEHPALVGAGRLGDSAVCPAPGGEGYVMIYVTDLVDEPAPVPTG